MLTDGPAAELKEQIGGYTLVECADFDEAIRWASTLPAARDASVQVRWPQLHMARADLLRRLDRAAEAVAAYRTALELEPAPAERAFISTRLRSLAGPAN